MIIRLLNEIASHGDRGAIIPFSRIDELKKDMIALKNEDYHTDWLNRMANSMNKDNIEIRAIFSEKETTELLNNKGDMPYTDSLAVKVEASGLLPEFAKPNVLSRNLVALFQNDGQTQQ